MYIVELYWILSKTVDIFLCLLEASFGQTRFQNKVLCLSDPVRLAITSGLNFRSEELTLIISDIMGVILFLTYFLRR